MAPDLLRTKLTPPRLHRRVLPRPALHARLSEALDLRLTVVQAGTGYGKTTALAALAAEAPARLWYTVEEGERDPQRFLAYLLEGFRLALPGLSDAPLVRLHEQPREGTPNDWLPVIDALLNALADALAQPTLLVLDDFHTVADAPDVGPLVERLISYAPPDLHIVLATRHPLDYAALVRWRARGDLLELDRHALTFQPPEIERLFREVYGVVLAPPEVARLAERTEGWPIALQLVGQRLRAGTLALPDLLAQSHAAPSLAALFEYLAQEVYAQQPPDLAAFLDETALLRELTPAACEAVSGRADSLALLARLRDLDLFVIELGERHYRYHHLFHDFLRQRPTDPVGLRARHRRAARFFHEQGQPEEAIAHWLAAESFTEAALAIEGAGEAALRAGRLEMVAGWIDALPPDVVAAFPLLQCFLGDLYRLSSRFDEALAWYAQAEASWRARQDAIGISRALRGQALVYLDTVRPARAESLLEEALRVGEGLADREARARLLTLLAENKLNLGKPEEAERLHAEARTLREEGPSEDALSVRVKLRTGRLSEARQSLERWVEQERREMVQGLPHPPRAHRETVLLLSLIESFMGNAEQAGRLAQEGIVLGEQLNSPFVTAVGLMRLGHALQLGQTAGGYEQAIGCYQRAIAMGDHLAVRRTRLEAMWGLTRAYGFGGNLEAARSTAAEGMEIGAWAGDSWVVALGDLALGSSYVLAGQGEQAVGVLERVLAAFRDCGDRFGRAVARLWLALAHAHLGQGERSLASLEACLTLCEAEGYDFLFTRRTLLGPPDPRCLVPLLLRVREQPRWRGTVARLLGEMGLAGLEVHPGYQLRVQALGAFRLWRGATEVEPRDWKRGKTRHLFQLLVTERGRWLHREEITERLWPDLAPDAAVRDFKVALTTLHRVLEPERAPAPAAKERPFAFIVREGTAYRLRPEADLWLDVVAFEQAAEAGLRSLARDEAEALPLLREAVTLYGGDYLPDARYEDWASETRERLLSLFLRAADALAGALMGQGQPHEVLALCQRLLAHDPCWENAYRLMMQAHLAQGNPALARRAYQRCVATLDEQLGVPPSPTTQALWRGLGEV